MCTPKENKQFICFISTKTHITIIDNKKENIIVNKIIIPLNNYIKQPQEVAYRVSGLTTRNYLSNLPTFMTIVFANTTVYTQFNLS